MSLPQHLIAPVEKCGRPAAREPAMARPGRDGGRLADLQVPNSCTDPRARRWMSEVPSFTNLEGVEKVQGWRGGCAGVERCRGGGAGVEGCRGGGAGVGVKGWRCRGGGGAGWGCRGGGAGGEQVEAGIKVHIHTPSHLLQSRGDKRSVQGGNNGFKVTWNQVAR